PTAPTTHRDRAPAPCPPSCPFLEPHESFATHPARHSQAARAVRPDRHAAAAVAADERDRVADLHDQGRGTGTRPAAALARRVGPVLVHRLPRAAAAAAGGAADHRNAGARALSWRVRAGATGLRPAGGGTPRR